jgi:hypothetical protein
MKLATLQANFYYMQCFKDTVKSADAFLRKKKAFGECIKRAISLRPVWRLVLQHCPINAMVVKSYHTLDRPEFDPDHQPKGACNTSVRHYIGALGAWNTCYLSRAVTMASFDDK